MFNFLTYWKLKNRKWERLSKRRRIKIFQKMENIEAKRQGRCPLVVLSKRLEGNMQGLCDMEQGVMLLSEEIFLQKERQFWGLTILFHEGRHAFQHNEAINAPEKDRVFGKKNRWKKSLQGYVNYDKNEKFSYYAMQDVERDANIYALKRLKSLGFWFKNEENFLNALQQKQRELDAQVTQAKKELGLFYKLKVLWRSKRERDKK